MTPERSVPDVCDRTWRQQYQPEMTVADGEVKEEMKIFEHFYSNIIVYNKTSIIVMFARDRVEMLGMAISCLLLLTRHLTSWRKLPWHQYTVTRDALSLLQRHVTMTSPLASTCTERLKHESPAKTARRTLERLITDWRVKRKLIWLLGVRLQLLTLSAFRHLNSGFRIDRRSSLRARCDVERVAVVDLQMTNEITAICACNSWENNIENAA